MSIVKRYIYIYQTENYEKYLWTHFVCEVSIRIQETKDNPTAIFLFLYLHYNFTLKKNLIENS